MKGIIDRVDSLDYALTADLTVLDDTGMPDICEALDRKGIPTFGRGHSSKKFRLNEFSFNSYEVQDTLESERGFGHALMEKVNLGSRFETIEFYSLGEAVQHLEEHKVPHVIKPEIHGVGAEKTYVSELPNGEDGKLWLETLPLRPEAGKIKKVLLEEKIQGIEVACSAFFNGDSFIYPININFEHKKIATGGLGFNTGEMGTVMYYDPRPISQVRLFTETLAKLSGFLKTVDYRGQIDINCIVNKDGIFPLEFTPRFGYPSSYIESELQITPWSELLYKVANKENFINEVSWDWGLGVVLVGEGFPFWDEGKKRMFGLPIYGVTTSNLPHIHFCDVMLMNDKLFTTGCYPLIATSKAGNLYDAQDLIYSKLVKDIFFPSMYYRIDIGSKTVEYINILNSYKLDMTKPVNKEMPNGAFAQPIG
jgi:phosphoribosylamine--glycine ligase